MRTLAMKDGDLLFERGSIKIYEGDEELAQAVSHCLSTAKGEWFLDEDYGLDRDAILGKGFNESEATDAIIEAVTQDERIERVPSIEFYFDKPTRTLRIEMTLQKTDGETIELEVTV